MLKRISIVIDIGLWVDDDLMKQMNAIEQGLINAHGEPKKYPILTSSYEPPPDPDTLEQGQELFPLPVKDKDLETEDYDYILAWFCCLRPDQITPEDERIKEIVVDLSNRDDTPPLSDESPAKKNIVCINCGNKIYIDDDGIGCEKCELRWALPRQEYIDSFDEDTTKEEVNCSKCPDEEYCLMEEIDPEKNCPRNPNGEPPQRGAE